MRFVLGLILYLSTVIAPLAAATKPIATFDELLAALKQGQAVRAVIHYGECKLFVDGQEEKSPAAIGGVEIWPWEYFPAKSIGNPRGFLSCSETRLIFHPRRGHVYNYVKLKFYDDGEVEINARYLKPKSFKVTMDETFKGVISGTDARQGVYLFTEE